MYSRKWKPSKAAAREFASKMNDIDQFCSEHGIKSSRTNDSYYFSLNGKQYRVSNHTIAASNKGAFNNAGEQVRELYHNSDDDVICITASKTRIVEIYNDLNSGFELDGRGNRKF